MINIWWVMIEANNSSLSLMVNWFTKTNSPMKSTKGQNKRKKCVLIWWTSQSALKGKRTIRTILQNKLIAALNFAALNFLVFSEHLLNWIGWSKNGKAIFDHQKSQNLIIDSWSPKIAEFNKCFSAENDEIRLLMSKKCFYIIIISWPCLTKTSSKNF